MLRPGRLACSLSYQGAAEAYLMLKQLEHNRSKVLYPGRLASSLSYQGADEAYLVPKQLEPT